MKCHVGIKSTRKRIANDTGRHFQNVGSIVKGNSNYKIDDVEKSHLWKTIYMYA